MKEMSFRAHQPKPFVTHVFRCPPPSCRLGTGAVRVQTVAEYCKWQRESSSL